MMREWEFKDNICSYGVFDERGEWVADCFDSKENAMLIIRAVRLYDLLKMLMQADEFVIEDAKELIAGIDGGQNECNDECRPDSGQDPVNECAGGREGAAAFSASERVREA